MMEEKKSYSINGKVEISTEEYRDLIYDKYEAEATKDRYMRDGWKKDEEIKTLKETIKGLTAKINRYKDFISKNMPSIDLDTISQLLDIER